VQHLRKKLTGDSGEPIIETVRSVGYRISEEKARA
jgi:DNA-binding response OmpR family regulator